MGSLRAQESHQKMRMSDRTFHESGILSIDFLAGISIFVITLILAATMISGLLISLQTKKIDYDAVAYRTGVILVEDPGEPNTQFNYLTITESDQWEFIGYDQKNKIRRFGLTLYKSTPRVLAEQKVRSFFNKAQFPRAQFSDLSEYRDRMIAGDYPYNFNVRLKIIGGDSYEVGDTFDPHSAYGYIRRVVLVKNQTGAEVDLNPYYINDFPDSNSFYVNMTYGWLLNQTRGPQYWIEPPKEDISVNLVNVGSIRNLSQASDVIVLENIRMTFDGRLLDGTEVSGVDLPYRNFTAEIDGNLFNFTWPSGAGNLTNVNEAINITFPAGYFIPPSAYAEITLIRMNIRYEFAPGTVNLSQTTHFYEYIPDSVGSPGFSPPHLTPAILEVRVW